MKISDEDREALLRVLVVKRKHRISDNGRGGYRCEEGHEYGPVVDAILASDVFARIVQGTEQEWEYGFSGTHASVCWSVTGDGMDCDCEAREGKAAPDVRRLRGRKAGEWEVVDD